MTALAERLMESIDREGEPILHDFLAWRTAVQDLREHNARLAEIVAELLLKNQSLRFSLDDMSNVSMGKIGLEKPTGSA